MDTLALAGESVLDLTGRGSFPLEFRVADPLILPQPYASPADYSAQYPLQVPTEEIIAMCEELSLWQALPEVTAGLKSHVWRELNALAFTSGTSAINFADGECPPEYTHSGSNSSVDTKNIGAKKTLSISDIMDSAAKVGMGQGIRQLIGGVPAGQGMPGGSDTASFLEEVVMNVKEKEMRAALTLVLNGWDYQLVNGDKSANSLAFDGLVTAMANGSPHTNDNTASGTFAASSFNQFLSESCAKPTALFGGPQVIQEMLQAYFQLGYNGSQLVNFGSGDRITPGFNFSGFVNTGIGRLPVIADNNFPKTNIAGGKQQAKIYAMRMNHNGTPLVFKYTQIPLSMNDLVPGCTAISFQAWAKTSLVIKHMCAHGVYTTQITGQVVTTCPVIH